MELLTFDQAIQNSEAYSKRHLLLGNGFSIACRPNIFVYQKLFERADFSELSTSAQKAFQALNTSDFEIVIKVLRESQKVLSAYDGVSPELHKQLGEDADGLKSVLVEAITSSHPDMPGDIGEEEYSACRVFLEYFDTTYTLNYDLLLYWACMHTDEGEAPESDDGFRKPDYDYEANYVVWDPGQSHDQNTWYLHGALHIFDTGTEIQKYTWINTGIRLKQQIQNALSRDYFPLFVAEGTSKEKLRRIKHSDYLAKAYRSFQGIGGALFVFGHSLSENDEHYLKLIEQGKIQHVYVGIFGDVNSERNRKITRRAQQMIPSRKRKAPVLQVSFYDSSTAKVWG